MPDSDQTQSDLPGVLEALRNRHAPVGTTLLLTAPFQQGWRAQPEAGFEPARAELRADHNAFHVLAVLGDRDIGNRATGFNERTWLTGDVFEIFLQTDADTYYEFHVTPENRHLFLQWTTERIAAFRQKNATLADAILADRDMLHSETVVRENENLWTVSARTPFAKIGLDPTGPNTDLKVAFARYDAFTEDRPPVLSATPAFPSPAYHNRSVWHRLKEPKKEESP